MSANTRWKSLLLAAVFSACCLASSIGPLDANCNPSIDPPSSGGCVWYNYYAFTDNTIHGGSSFQNYYVSAPDPPWTIDTAGPAVLRVLDGGHQGDVFSVFDNNVEIGSTSLTSIDANHSCANDSTGEGTDPAACWNDLLMSRGTFLLGAGSHSLTVTWDQRVPGGNSSLQWFEIGASPAATAPEPGSIFLFASGLVLIGLGISCSRA